MKAYLGVEIGGTKQQLAIGNEKGELLYTLKEQVALREGAPDILRWLEAHIPPLLSDGRWAVQAIGVGFGGPLETATGRVLQSLQVPGWENFALRRWFQAKFDKPVRVMNDTVAGGYAEWALGAGEKTDSFFYTNIGTGIGGVHIIAGKIQDGYGFGASALGNTWVPDWMAQAPGEPQEMELLCSGRSIERRLNSRGYLPADSLLAKDAPGGRVTCQDLGEAVRAGDGFAAAELDRICRSFSIALANLLMIAPARRVAIGGGVAKMGDILFSRIRAFLETYAYVANRGRTEVLPSRLLDNAVIQGAILAVAELAP